LSEIIKEDGEFYEDTEEDTLEEAESIIDNNEKYSDLSFNEKFILNDKVGLREDTMIECEKRGYSISDSVYKALIMQRLNISFDDTILMIEMFGNEQKAANETLKFRKYEYSCAFMNDEEVRSELLEELKNGVETEKIMDIYAFSKIKEITYKEAAELLEEERENFEEEELLKIAGSLEKKSEHLIAQAILEKVHDCNIDIIEVSDFKAVMGKGVKGKIQNQSYYGGNLKYMQENNIDIKAENDEIIINKEMKSLVLYPVGLALGTYIVAENEDGMYLIDQHAAAERINYEKILKQMNEKPIIVDLLVPIKIELRPDEFILIKERFELLEKYGFNVQEFGFNTIIIRSHPSWIPEDRAEDIIRKIVDIIIEKGSFDFDQFVWRMAATTACRMSVMANTYISEEDQEWILENIRYCDNPFTCPHGRPTIITYSRYELERLFKRQLD